MPAVYANHGIQFQYPENWTLSEEAEDQPREIFVESPCGAFWSLHVYQEPADPHQLALDVVDAMRKEYANVEVDPITTTIGNDEVDAYELFFFYLDLIVRCRACSFTRDGRTFVLMTQGEDRDFERLGPIFAAMTESLIRNL